MKKDKGFEESEKLIHNSLMYFSLFLGNSLLLLKKLIEFSNKNWKGILLLSSLSLISISYYNNPQFFLSFLTDILSNYLNE